MTRINIHMKPVLLTDQHLLAEHREIVRLAKLSKDYWARDPKRRSAIPSQFILGKGHVTFFYDKMDLVADRYAALLQECTDRGFDVTDMSDAFDNLAPESVGKYVASDRDINRAQILLFLRLMKRLGKSMQTPRYMGEPVDFTRFVGAMSLSIFGKVITLENAELSDEDKQSI